MDAERLRSVVESELTERGRLNGYTFGVATDGVYEEDGWWHVIVEPLAAGVRAYQFADMLSQVEQELGDRIGIKLLLVPGIGVAADASSARRSSA